MNLASGTLRGLVAAAVIVAGCASTPEPSERGPFDGMLPAVGDTPPLPVRVEDRTGQLVAVAIADPGMLEDGVSGVPGRDDALHVQWTGGMCDQRVRILVEPVDDGLSVTLDTDRAGACLLAGIGRGLLLEFAQNVDPTTVSFTDVDGP